MIAPEAYIVGTVTAQISCLILAAVLFAYSFNKTIQGRLGIAVSLILAGALLFEAGLAERAISQGFPISLIMLFGCGSIIWFRLVFLGGVSVEGYSVRPQEFGVLALMLGGYFASIYFDPAGQQDLALTFQLTWLGIIIVLNCLVLYIAFFALGSDMAETRHQIRLSILLPLIVIAAAFNTVAVVSLFGIPALTAEQNLEIIVTVSLLFIVMLVAWGLAPHRTAVFGSVLPKQEVAEPGARVAVETLAKTAAAVDIEPDEAIENGAILQSGDQVVLNRLTILMKNEEFFKEQGLTIDQLSRRLAVPSYVLRRVINHGLNFRNFASFLNHFRIEAACAELSNPELSHKQIIGVAMDVGYQSLGPFNRAFKEAHGVTPSVYRKHALEGHPDIAGGADVVESRQSEA